MKPKTPVEVAIALVWRDGRLLIARRAANIHLGGCWEFPGGKCGPGEEPAACARREVAEELGLDVEPLAPRPVIEYEYPERRVRLHPFDCRCPAGEPRPDARGVTAWRWVRVEELARYEFPPANAPLLAELRARGAPVPSLPREECR